MGNENTRALGIENEVTVVNVLVPQADNGNTEILSAAVDIRNYPRCRILLVATYEETTPGDAHTMTFTITQSDASGGTYDATTPSGTLTAMANDGTQVASFVGLASHPFIKVAATGSSASLAGFIAAYLLFIKPGF
jgi:hypothetical protein